jgi:hypothetical protein
MSQKIADFEHSVVAKVVGCLPLTPGLGPRPVHLVFVVGKVALRQVFSLPAFQISLVQYHYTIAAYLLH